MIDSLPNHSPAIPVFSAPPATSAQSLVNSADPASKANLSPPNAAATQESFTNALQNRLRLNSLNKAPNSQATPANTATPVKAIKLPEPTISAVDLADLTITASSSAPPDPAAINQIDPSLSSAQPVQANSDAESPVIAPAAPDSVTLPIALNTINPLAQATGPQSPGQSAKDSASRYDTATANSNTKLTTTEDALTKNSVPAAIIAAVPEKTDQTAANTGSKNGDALFTDVLHNAITQSNANPSQTPQGPITREIASPLSSTQWASDVGNQLSWMVGKRESHAELVLNPPQLGRIEVSITMNGDQASANFVSANPEVRDALTGSLPRLREVLADAGVFLGQANVGAESFNQSGNDAEKGRKSPGDSISSGRDTLLGSNSRPVSAGVLQVNRGQGLIDLFA